MYGRNQGGSGYLEPQLEDIFHTNMKRLQKLCTDISEVQSCTVLIEESQSVIKTAGYAFARITAENTCE